MSFVPSGEFRVRFGMSAHNTLTGFIKCNGDRERWFIIDVATPNGRTVDKGYRQVMCNRHQTVIPFENLEIPESDNPHIDQDRVFRVFDYYQRTELYKQNFRIDRKFDKSLLFFTCLAVNFFIRSSERTVELQRKQSVLALFYNKSFFAIRKWRTSPNLHTNWS